MAADVHPTGSDSAPSAASAVIAHPHKDKASLQTLALQAKLEIALCQGLLWAIVAFGLPIAAIPQHHRAAAILAFPDGTFEIAVVERMILDLNGKTLVVRIERRFLEWRGRFGEQRYLRRLWSDDGSDRRPQGQEAESVYDRQ
jgi:hypothetical protein